MKKLIGIMIIAAFAMVLAGSAYAEDRLSISGQYYARGWYNDIDEDQGLDDSQYYVDQRMRIQAKIAVADGISATIRGDLAEGTWGESFSTGGRGSVARPGNQSPSSDKDFRNAFDIDRTYVTIDKDMWTLQVGQQYYALGHIAEVMDTNMTGVKLVLKFDGVKVTGAWQKSSENGDWPFNVDDDGTEDTDIFSANVDFSIGDWGTKVYGAMVSDDGTDDEPWAVGVSTGGALGMFNLVAELDFLGGDTAGGDDYQGLQFYVKGDTDLSEMMNVGGEFLYAAGDDSDVQISGLTDWATFTPMGNNTPEDGWISGTNFNPFDPLNSGAGVIGGTLFISATPMDKVAMGAKVGYFSSEDDDAADGDVTAANAWASYELADNTKLALTYLYSKTSNDDTDIDLKEQTAVLRLAVSF